MKDQPLVILDRLAAGYDRQPVLRNVSVQIEPGTLTAILGGNGSGKTTLLKTIAGILPPLAGAIRFPTDPPVIGYVPQRESLDSIFLFSALEIVKMGTYGRLRPGRMAGSNERAFALECLVSTGAGDLAGHLYSELSGGQKQRVLIARALATRPGLLLLDEPTAGIDPAASKLILELLLRLHLEQRLTILLVTHDLAAARHHCQDVIWIQRGQLEHGPAPALLRPDRIADLLELS